MSREVILNFHGVGEPHAGVEADERPYWITEAFFADIVARAALLPQVRFTFDDGNASDLEIAAPLLARHGRVGSFFVLTGRVGQPHYLGAAQIGDLRDCGMEIGLHGADHLDWRKLKGEALARETVTARAELAALAGHAIEGVAIPFGAYNRRIIDHLKACSFGTIYTSDNGPTSSTARIRNRTSIRADMDMSTIENILHNRGSARLKLRRALSRVARRYVV